jgi:hypothetical protein
MDGWTDGWMDCIGLEQGASAKHTATMRSEAGSAVDIMARMPVRLGMAV